VKSLERQFVVGLAVMLLAVFGLLFWGSVTAVRSIGEAYVLMRLEHDAESLVAALGPSPRGQMRLREGRITPIYQQPLSGHYFTFLINGSTAIRSRSLWDETLPVTPTEPGTVLVQELPGPGGQRLMIRTAGYAKGGQRFTLLVAEDLAPITRQIERFQLGALGLLTFAMLAVLLVQRLVLRRGFRGLDRIRAELQRVSSGGMQQIEDLGPSEIRPLTSEVNRLLRQLQQRLQRSRQALGNLAHALKAPLSLLTQDVESLPLTNGERQRLSARLERIRQLVDRELRRARIAGEGPGRRFVPAAHVPELIEAVNQLYRGRSLEIMTSAMTEAMLPLDYEDMLELLGNLLDNACKWADHRVHLEITVDEAVTMTVADDGPGLARDAHDALLQRGSRLDEQERGHGLGLAIVRDLVDDYHGRLQLGRSAHLGGLEVRVVLPVEPEPP
jgi:signal transduction histidine kinase